MGVVVVVVVKVDVVVKVKEENWKQLCKLGLEEKFMVQSN